ncbi:MAG: hypothetical protein WBO21_10290 [Acidimicrobiia bacterium]
MNRLIFAIVALVVLVAAASPAEVAPVLEAQGFFVESGSNADPNAVEVAVAEARFEGGELSVAVLASEPAGGATIFAENTLDEMGGRGTVFTVGPETVGWASEGDIYTNEELDNATDVSLDGGTDTEVVELFVATLIGEPVGAAEPGGGGGLPWGWILLFIVIAGGAFFLWRRSQSSKRSETAAIDSARAEVKKRLDDVANDIIDLETEVASSEIVAVPVLYKSATEAYSKALKEYDRAETASQLMATAEDLDQAIWQLDSVEALLDGKPAPPKPEKPKLPQPTAPPRTSTSPPPAGGSPLDTPPRVPQTTYRRPARRSSSNTSAILTGILMGAMSSSRRSPWGSSGSSRRSGSSGSSSRSRSSGRSRMRGGGRRRR